MKRRISSLIIVLGVALFTVSCAASKQVSAEQEQAVQKAIAEKEFEIDVTLALPMRGRSVPLTSPYSLAVKGDSVYSYLPYFGRAYNIPYGGGVGFNFSGPLKNYNVAAGKKGMSIITFQGQSPEENVEYTVTMGLDGHATITAHSQNREPIRFEGKVVLK